MRRQGARTTGIGTQVTAKEAGDYMARATNTCAELREELAAKDAENEKLRELTQWQTDRLTLKQECFHLISDNEMEWLDKAREALKIGG